MNQIDHDTEEAARRFLALIASRYDMAGAIVYGSRARGTHRPDSDADVAVLLCGERQLVSLQTLPNPDSPLNYRTTGIMWFARTPSAICFASMFAQN